MKSLLMLEEILRQGITTDDLMYLVQSAGGPDRDRRVKLVEIFKKLLSPTNGIAFGDVDLSREEYFLGFAFNPESGEVEHKNIRRESLFDATWANVRTVDLRQTGTLTYNASEISDVTYLVLTGDYPLTVNEPIQEKTLQIFMDGRRPGVPIHVFLAPNILHHAANPPPIRIQVVNSGGTVVTQADAMYGRHAIVVKTSEAIESSRIYTQPRIRIGELESLNGLTGAGLMDFLSAFTVPGDELSALANLFGLTATARDERVTEYNTTMTRFGSTQTARNTTIDALKAMLAAPVEVPLLPWWEGKLWMYDHGHSVRIEGQISFKNTAYPLIHTAHGGTSYPYFSYVGEEVFLTSAVPGVAWGSSAPGVRADVLSGRKFYGHHDCVFVRDVPTSRVNGDATPLRQDSGAVVGTYSVGVGSSFQGIGTGTPIGGDAVYVQNLPFPEEYPSDDVLFISFFAPKAGV